MKEKEKRMKPTKYLLLSFSLFALASCGGVKPSITSSSDNASSETTSSSESLSESLVSSTTSESSETTTSESSETPVSESSESSSSESSESIEPLETKYTILFDLDGGSSPSFVHYKTVDGFSKDDFFYDCTKSNYTFKGWSQNGTKVLDEAGNVVKTPFMADMMVFKALYSLTEYSITYHLEDGINNPSNPDTYNYEQAVNLLEPTNGSFVFDNWYDNPEYTGEPITTIPQGSTGAKNLYARWLLPAPYSNLKYTKNDNNLTITGVYDNTVTDIKIPSTIASSCTTCSVTNITKGAFQDCTLVETISVPFVGGSKDENCFFGYIFGATTYDTNDDYVPTSLKEASILDGCQAIPNYAFFECNKIIAINLPNTVASIGERAFTNNHNLCSINIPRSVTRIENGAFYGCLSLKYIYIPCSVEYIGNNAFRASTQLSMYFEIETEPTSWGYAWDELVYSITWNYPNS